VTICLRCGRNRNATQNFTLVGKAQPEKTVTVQSRTHKQKVTVNLVFRPILRKAGKQSYE